MASTTTTTVAQQPQDATPVGPISTLEVGRFDGEANTVHEPVFSRFTSREKASITVIVAFCGLLASMSTTSIFAAVPEIVAEYDTTPEVLNTSSALYLVFMGISSVIWGPSADILGRRKTYLWSISLFFAFSLGTALSPTLVSFFVCRAFTAAQGTAFLILGSSCISDIYHPTERATSIGWFMCGTMAGPAFGPLIGGIIVTYTSWRVIFWLQTAMSGTAALLIYFLLLETIHIPRSIDLKGKGFADAVRNVWRWASPWTICKLYARLNLLCVMLASSALVWNMYTLLTPVRYVLNPRLNLTTPLQSGLLYIAPGAGYIIGVLSGGRLADYTTRRWMTKRGYRLPEDRLRSCMIFLGLLLPGSMTTYGWMLDKRVGGIPVPVICMFMQGLAQSCAFASLNSYILDVMPGQTGAASASHYMMRYILAGVAAALCLPMIGSVGVGWMSTISSALLLACAGLVFWTIRSGEKWRAVQTERT